MVLTSQYTDWLDAANCTVSITVTGVPTRVDGSRITKKFYGAFFPTEQQCFEDAYEECLKYLVNEGLLIIDDYNYSMLKTKEAELFQKTSWENIYAP